jgi:hypothetical protein
MRPDILGHITNLEPGLSDTARDQWFIDRRALLVEMKTTMDFNLIQEAIYGEDEVLAEYVISNPLLTQTQSRYLMQRFEERSFTKNSFLCNPNLHPTILEEWALGESDSRLKCCILRHPNAQFLSRETIAKTLASISKPSLRLYLLEDRSIDFPLEILEDWATEAPRNSKIRGMIQGRSDFPEDSRIIVTLRRM